MSGSGQDGNTLQNYTVTPTVTPPSQPTQKPSNKGVAPANVAGIVVGVSVFVAALTGIIVFILMRRSTPFLRSKKRSSIGTQNRSQSSRAFQTRLGKRRSGRRDQSEKAQEQLAVPEEGTVQFVDLDRDLPQPISEGDLLQGWEKLSVSIKNHVTDCYHREKADQRYHVDKSSPLAYLESYHLADPKSRHLAIRQCIGKFIVENIEPEGNPDDTFLPPKLVSIIRSMPIMADKNSPLLEAALARWRVITNFLLYPERDMVSTEYMINSDIIKRAAEKLSNDLQPYLQPIRKVSEEECKASLEKTLRLGAKFGLQLFSQGARWSFGSWDIRERNEKKGRRSLVVLPALLKMTDEYGHFLRNPLVLHEETCVDF
ncbi:hypothetical protein MMC31_003071 [Peltigera leucophlebia]|nr:hypothetical protein [Peltigera leucophlebia]